MHRFGAIGATAGAIAVLVPGTGSAGPAVVGPPELPGCNVTTPKQRGERGLETFYGNRRLRAIPPTRDGVIRARPGSRSPALRPDGSVRSKVPWFGRRTRKRLRITGRRLDGPAGRLRANVSQHLRRDGVWPGALVWPTTGCWKVVGRVGRTRIAFVVAVVAAEQ